MTATDLYGPEERRWWSRNDHAAVVDVVSERLRAKVGADAAENVVTAGFRVLEFGPGGSTLSLIEGGATHIDTVEDDPDWAAVYRARLEARFPEIVRLYEVFAWSDPLTLGTIDGEAYDLAFVDGPKGLTRRPSAVRYALERCAAVLLPTENEHPDYGAAITALADEFDCTVDIRQTGPLSGSFALLTRRPMAAETPLSDEERDRVHAASVAALERYDAVGQPAPAEIGALEQATAPTSPLSKRAQKKLQRATKAKGGTTP